MKILSVNTARAAKRLIQGRPVSTAIGKQPVEGPVGVFALGLEGDEQADQSVHGGQSKAVYLYPVQHLAFWQTVRAQAGVAAADAPIAPGLFGENLTVDGIDEAQLWIGDMLRGPGCTLVVSEPRNPCYKFNAVMGFPQASSLMNQSGYCGAYLAVLHPGLVQAGEEFTLEPGPREVNLRELFLAKHQRGGRRSFT
ncbi:MAG TPA: MOSC domain-containing protein [Aquabacterium sp.]|nr:MOSC domain-containing protein [Aquabacterium sp.]